MPQDNQNPQPKTPSKTPAIIAAAVLIAAPMAAHFEGYRGRAYYDPAHILTVCYGDTANIDPARIYSRDECAARLRARMARDFAPQLLHCMPQLNDMRRKYVFGALLDASYNAGAGGVCRSPMAAHVRAGQWTAACWAFVGWRVSARNRRTGQRITYPGLVTRRKMEKQTCLSYQHG